MHLLKWLYQPRSYTMDYIATTAGKACSIVSRNGGTWEFAAALGERHGVVNGNVVAKCYGVFGQDAYFVRADLVALPAAA
jgi:hypothetical protein